MCSSLPQIPYLILNIPITSLFPALLFLNKKNIYIEINSGSLQIASEGDTGVGNFTNNEQCNGSCRKDNWEWGTFSSGTSPTEQKGFEQTSFDEGALLKTSCRSIFLSLLRSFRIIFLRCFATEELKPSEYDGSTMWESFYKAGNNKGCLFSRLH